MKTIFSILILLSISFNANAGIVYKETDFTLEYFLNNGWKIINTYNENFSTRFTLHKKKSSTVVCDLKSSSNHGAREQCHISP